MAKRDNAERAEDSIDTESRVYELGFHLDPELPAEEVKKAYGEVRGAIAAHGSIVAEGEPQMVQLSYVISRQDPGGRRDFDSAHFSWIVYEASPEAHEGVIAAAGANMRIIRFIDLVTTKEEARHSVEMRELSEKMQKPAEGPEAALDTELDAALENALPAGQAGAV